jgi:hypothetical protein
MSEIIPAESVEAVLPEVIPAEAIEDVASADVIPADVVEQALPEGEYLSKLTRNQIVREALQARLAGEQDMTKYRAAYRQRAAEGKLLDDNRLEPDKSEGTLSSAWSVLSETARSMYEGTKELAVQAGRATGIDWERSSLTGAMYTLPEGEAEKGFENVAQASKMQLLRSAHLLNTFASRVANRLLDAGTDHSDTSFLSDPSDIRVIAFDRQFDLDLGVAMAEEGFKQGVQVSGKQFPTDPEKVEQVAASPLVDPTMMVPAAVGFMGARGSVTTAARALTAGGKAHLDEVAVQAAGKVLSKPVAAAAKVFQAAEVSANESPLMRGVLAAGVTTVAGGEPTTAALAAIAGTAVSKIRVLGAVGNSLEATAGKLAGRVPPGPLGRFAVASYRAVAPEARAAVAGQLANTPFLLGSGDEEDFKHMLAGGLVAHAAGRAAGATVNGLDIASNLWRPRNAAPETRLAVKDYGVDPALDLAHRKVVDGLGNTSSNYVQRIRDYFRKERGESYALFPEDYAAALDRFAEQGAITKEFAADAKRQQGVTLQLKDEKGQPRAVALQLVTPRLPGLSVGHEAGHLLERLLSPEERKFIYEETRRYYGDEQVKEYQARYDELADTTGDAVKLGNQPIEATLSEIFAEHVSAVLNSVPIAQFGERRGAGQYARSVYSLVARGLEKIGVKQPQLVGGESGPTTGTGIEPSARLGHLVENVLLAHRLDRRRVGNVFGTVDEPAAPAKEASGPLENVRPAPKNEPGFRKGDPIGDIRDGDGMLVGEDAKVVRPLENGRYEVEYTDPDTGVRMRGEVDGSTLESPVKPDAGAPKPVPGLITHPHPITPDTPFGAPRAEDVVAPKQLDNPEAPLPVPDQTQNTVRPEGVRDSRTANVRTTPEAQAQYAKKASPEVLKQNLDTVKRVAAAPRSEIPAVETDYYSARSDVFAPDAKVRAEQRRLADQAEQNGGPNPLRAVYQKVFVPYRFVDGPTPRVFGFSLDKLIQNVDVLRGWMREKGLDTRYLESAQLRTDIQTYLDNHAHGYGGGGQRLQRPANTRPGSVTPEDPSYTPRPLSQEAMQTINLLMGLPQPTSRTPGQAYLETFARLNGLDPLARSNGTAEVNPLRARLASQGFDPRLLNSAVENLPVANFTTPLKVRSDLHFPAGDTAFTQGGFMPRAKSSLSEERPLRNARTMAPDDGAAQKSDGSPQSGLHVAGELREVWQEFTSARATERDVLEVVEGLLKDDRVPAELADVAEQYRTALTEDATEYAGRGDVEPAETRFIDSVERLFKQGEPATLPTAESGSPSTSLQEIEAARTVEELNRATGRAMLQAKGNEALRQVQEAAQARSRQIEVSRANLGAQFMPVEKTYSWLKPNGEVEPVKTIHADAAARLLNVGPRDGMREAFRQGWARVTQFADQLMVETPNPISDKQRQALIDLAIETGKRDIVLDNHGTSPRLVWSVEDQLPAGAFMPRTQPDQLGFFSQLERTLAAVPEKATRQQIEAALRDGVKAKGQLVERPVRQEELADVKDATGLSFAEWMKQNPDATREDMLDFVRENRVQVQEKQFRSSEFGEGVEQSYTAEDWQRMSEQWERVAQSWQRNGDQAMADRYFAKAERAARYAEGLNDEGVAVGTKYEQYQLPGGENYREAVLTLPGKKVATRFNIYDREGKLLWDQPATEDAARRGAEAVGGRYEPVEWETSTAEGYVSPHFRDTPGYLAHTRYNERTAAPDSAALAAIEQKLVGAVKAKGVNSLASGAPELAVTRGAITEAEATKISLAKGWRNRFNPEGETRAGEKVLFAEEIQSDLHQEGRKKGYRDGPDPLSAQERAEYERLRDVRFGDMTQEERQRFRQLDESAVSDSPRVPDAPFKKSWPELVFKYLLRKAAEKGSDFLAWTTGEQQAARYDLSKQINEVRYVEENGHLIAYPHAGSPIEQYGVKPEQLSDFIGKEGAEKLMAQPNTNRGRLLQNADLKVGGEGMRGFYDEMLPRAVDKMLKRWGVKTETLPLLDSGWQVQEVIGGTHVGKWLARHKEYGAAKQSPWFNSEAEAKAWVASQTSLDVHAVRLTPEMRADILENGQPMFMPQGEPTKQESLVSRALASRVTELPSPTGWVLPDGTYEGMQDRSGKFTNSGDFHLTALEQNKQRNADRFGFELPTNAEDARLAALQRGFVRVRYDGRTGRMGVEANERFFRGTQRAAVEDVVEANLDRLDRLDINLFDDAGKVTSSRGASLFTLDGLEKSQAALDLVSGRQRAAASFMPAVRDLEDFKAPTLAKALKRPGWTILTATQEKLGDHTAPANVEANAKLRQELTERGFPFTEVAGKYLGVDQGTNFLVTGISERSAVALGKKYKQESVLTHRGLVYQDGSISPVNPRNTLVGPEAVKQDFHSVLPDGTPFMLGLDFDTRIQPDPRSTPSYREVSKHLTPAEREGVRSDTAKNLVDLFDELPSDKDFITAVELGKAKRGWYERAAKTLREIFGPDTETFVSLLAATSPRQSVVDNLAMALDVWKAWTEVGRPQDPVAIRELVASRVEMEARTPNVIRALTGKDLEDAPIATPKKLNPGTELSGFKVESFRRNLLGDLLHSTNDAWMANFSGIDQRLFGTKAGYLAFTAKIRRVAKKTGLQPAEVQETIWSFFKTLYEATSVKKPAKEALAELTERDVMSAPEFHELLTEHPEILAQLERIGISKSKIAGLVDPALAGKRAAAGDQPLASALVQEGRSDSRVLARLAARAQRMKNAELAGVKVDEPETDPF